MTLGLLGDLETRAGDRAAARALLPAGAGAQPARHRPAAARALTPVRVVFLTHYYPPEAGAPQTRIAALAAGSCARGWDVTVHTGFPHYPTGRDRRALPQPAAAARDGPGGERGRAQRGLRDSQPRLRAAAARPRLARASALATAPASGPADVVVAESAAAVPRRRRRAATPRPSERRSWSTSPTAGRRAPSSSARSRDPRAIAAAEALERWIYARAAAVAVPTEGLLAGSERRARRPAGSCGSPPAVDLERFAAPAARRPPGARCAFSTRARSASRTGSARCWRRRGVAGPDVVRVTIAGGGAEAERLAGRARRQRARARRRAGRRGPGALRGRRRRRGAAARPAAVRRRAADEAAGGHGGRARGGALRARRGRRAACTADGRGPRGRARGPRGARRRVPGAPRRRGAARAARRRGPRRGRSASAGRPGWPRGRRYWPLPRITRAPLPARARRRRRRPRHRREQRQRERPLRPVGATGRSAGSRPQRSR